MKTNYPNLVIVIATFFSLRLCAQNKVSNVGTISFQENKGQICDQNYQSRQDVLFSGNANGINYHLTSSGISYQLSRYDDLREITKSDIDRPFGESKKISVYRIDLNWLNIKSNIKVLPQEQIEGYDNYYLGHCKEGVTHVKSYKSIVYENIYNGINLKWYEKDGQLEYDFIVKPGVDYKQIKIAIKGASLRINSMGELEMKTPFGTIVEKAPVVFQNKKILKSNWELNGNTISFNVDNVDLTKVLIIDPAVRVWGTYYGGANNDVAFSCTTSSLGDVYVAGYTTSGTSTIIATTGAHQTTLGGQNDGFLAKFNASGVRQWATYYGGTADDFINSCVVDNSGSAIYLAGETASSSGIATAASHQTIFGGGTSDAFLLSFNSSGVRQWGTYYGGADIDYGKSVCLDPSGNIFLAGYTTSSVSANCIATPGSHQSIFSGNSNGTDYDGYLVKFNNSGVRQWGTYYGGGSVLETVNACASDLSGNIYIVGSAYASSTAIATPGSHQPTQGGLIDAYLAKFDNNGVRQWGTYYGSTASDNGFSCTVDLLGSVIIVGSTQSQTGISSPGAYQTNYSGSSGNDAFIVKFNALGVRQWGTYYGGTLSDNARCVVSNSLNEIFVSGTTGSSGGNSMATQGSHQYVYGGGSTDCFIAKFSAAGNRSWGSYYGSSASSENGYGCTVNGLAVYLCGYTPASSGTEIATLGSHQSVYGGGGNDAFLVKFNDCAGGSFDIVGNLDLCIGQSSTLTTNGVGITSYTWSNSSNASSVIISPTITTTYSVSVNTATAICKYSTIQTVSVSPVPTVNISASTVICSGAPLLITASGALTYSWNTTSTTPTIAPTLTTNTTFTVVGANGICTDTKTIAISVNPLPSVSLTVSNSTMCTISTGGQTINLTGSPSGGIYNGVGVSGNIYTPANSSGNYNVVYSYTDVPTGCSNSATQIITISDCTGITEMSNQTTIIIFPNPASSSINIETDLIGFDILIYDSSGKQLWESKNNLGKITIDLNRFSKGLYTLKINSDSGFAIKKIVIE